eukprot:7213422-Pyramimonas_sp.AAC.1
MKVGGQARHKRGSLPCTSTCCTRLMVADLSPLRLWTFSSSMDIELKQEESGETALGHVLDARETSIAAG